MHVIQLFFRFFLRIQVERIILRLPERFSGWDFSGKLWSHTAKHPLEFHAGGLFPAFHESAQLARFAKPHDKMHVVWHDHISRTNPAVIVELLNKYFEQSVSQWFTVEHPSSVVARECYEVSMTFLVVDSSRHSSPGSVSINLSCCAHRHMSE